MTVRYARRVGYSSEWWIDPVLVRGSAGDEFASVDKITHAGKQLPGLVAGEPFAVASVEDHLNQSIRDFRGEVGCGEDILRIVIC